MVSKADDLPYVIKRHQFPVRLCFAMTINKSQGQSFDMVGVDLRQECFTHAQLYVALSRVIDVRGSIVCGDDEDHHHPEVVNVYDEDLIR